MTVSNFHPFGIAKIQEPFLIFPLRVEQKEELLNHFMALSEEDRGARFLTPLSRAGVSAHIEKIDFFKDRVLGVYVKSELESKSVLAGVCSIFLHDNQTTCEFGISVLAKHRKLGIAVALLASAIDCIKSIGYLQLKFHCQMSNRSMIDLARKLDAKLEIDGCGNWEGTIFAK